MSERERHFRAEEPSGRFTLLLVVGSPPAHAERLRDRRRSVGSARHLEATLSVARAAFAAGGRVVMPSDRGMAPVLAALALDYAAVAATERAEPVAHPLVVADSAGSDPTLAALLAPYAARGAVLHVGRDGEAVRLEQVWDRTKLDPEHPPRHPVTPELLRRWESRMAIFVTPGDEAHRDLLLLREHGVQAVSLAHADPAHVHAWDLHDVALAFREEGADRWTTRERSAREDRAETVPPYAFLAQRLVRDLRG